MSKYVKRELLPPEIDEILNRGWAAYGREHVFYKFNRGNIIMNDEYWEIVDRVMEFKCKPDDIFLSSYPKSGSHWLQEICWLIQTDADFESVKIPQMLRAPRLEDYCFMWHYMDYIKEHIPQMVDPIAYTETLPSPRMIKTHMNYESMPLNYNETKPKTIVNIRNPKDVFCSLYPFISNFQAMTNVSQEEFAKVYMSGYCPLADIVEWYLSWWNRRNDPNVFIVTYEETKNDPVNTVKRLAKFLNKEVSEEKIKQIIEFTSVENMRKIGAFELDKLMLAVNHEVKESFIRKGKVGSWKEDLSPELNAKMDKYIQPLIDAGIKFQY